MNVKKNVIKRLLTYTKPHIWFLIAALFASVISVTLTLLAPVLIGNAIDFIVDRGNVDFNSVIRILIILGITIVFSAFFQWLISLCTNTVAFKTIKDIRTAAFGKLNLMPLKYIDSHSHGDIMARIVTDVDQISDGLLQGFTQLFTGIITIIGTICFMLSVNTKITIVVVLVTPLSLFVAAFIGRATHKYFTIQAKTRGELGGYVEEMIGNQKIVKAFGYEKRAEEQFSKINKELYSCGVKAQFSSSLSNPCTRFVNAIVSVAVGVFGAIFVVRGIMTVGQLSCFLQYANQYTKPFNEITGVVTELQNAIASAKRVFDLLDEPVETDDSSLLSLAICDGTVNLDDVSFSYSETVKLIENLNLDVKSGQRIALVGPTGCGKTTIINLLMRFYDVTGGRITVSEHNIKSIKRHSLREKYGMVLQDTWLFSGTIRDNIAYGLDGATDEQVVAAAKTAHAHSFIKKLKNGYDTMISEEGGNISGGQKQLLCIARIMLTHPPMLILDEATSSIDTRTELAVQRAFAKLMNGRTSFIVAHRLSTIKEADTILVMNNGRIVEKGNHEFLLQNGGFYAELYNSQFDVSE